LLDRARQLGYLGPPPIEEHLAHAGGFADAYRLAQEDGGGPALAADLGSGGGVPALPLALRWPESVWLLIESGERRAAFLAEAVSALGLAGRVTVRGQRAEEVGRDPELRGRCDLVTARSFGPSAVTAECGGPLLVRGGALIVSEPPGGDPGRWPDSGLAALGLTVEAEVPGPPAFQVVRQTGPCPERYPRRVGIPAKRPLW